MHTPLIKKFPRKNYSEVESTWLFLQEKRTVQIKWKHVLLEIIKSIGLYVYVTVMNQSRVLGVPGYSHADGILVHMVIQDSVLL